MTCPYSDFRLSRLPKGSSCKDFKNVPARSAYWRDDTDSVERCDSFKGDSGRPPKDEGGEGGLTDKQKLMKIDGIGEKRAETLINAFGDVRGVSRAAASHWASIEKLDGFSTESAKNMFDKMRDAGVFEGTVPDDGPEDRDDEPDDGVKRCDRDRYPKERIEGERSTIGPWENTKATVDITRWKYTEPDANAVVGIRRVLSDGFENCFEAIVAGWGDEKLVFANPDSGSPRFMDRTEVSKENIIRSNHNLVTEVAVNWMLDHQDPPATAKENVGAWERVSEDPLSWETTMKHPFRGSVTAHIKIIEEERRGQTVYGYEYDIPEFGKGGHSLSDTGKSGGIESAESWMQRNQPDDYEIELPKKVEGWKRHEVTNEHVIYRSYQRPKWDEPTYTQRQIKLDHKEPSASWRIRGHWVDSDDNVTRTTFTPSNLPDKSSLTGGRSGTRSNFADPTKAWGYTKEYMEEHPEQLVEFTNMPRFEVSGENKMLRGILEPIKRHGVSSMGQEAGTSVSVDSEGAIDFEGVDSSNVLMYQTSLLFANLDSASVDREGDGFGANIVTIADTADDVNMTESFTLSTEYPDEQNVPPKLVYKSGSGERASTHLSENGRAVDVPDIEMGPSVSGVSAGQFKKTVKATGKIEGDNPAIAFVTTPGEAYLVHQTFNDDDEPFERARARLTGDNSDIVYDRDTDRSVTFVSFDYMKDIAMSPYRPATTEVKMQQSLAGADGNEANSPLFIDYEQRGGIVRYMVAPRVRSKGANKWDLSSDDRHKCPPVKQWRMSIQTDECPYNGIELSEPLQAGDNAPDVGPIEYDGDTVVWFFPNTSGCRCGAQALDLNRLHSETPATVYGVSHAPESKHESMKEKYDLGFEFLSDPDGDLADAFGVDMNEGVHDRAIFFVRDGQVTDVAQQVEILNQPEPDGCPVGGMTLKQEDENALFEHLKHPGVYIVTGKRGSGKSSLAMRIAEGMHERDGVTAATVGMPHAARKHFPDHWVHVENMDDAPPNAAVVVDEAYAKFHSRDSMSDENKSVSQMVNTSRHCQQTFLFVSQNSAHLDKAAPSEADGLLMKEPGTFHMEFERRQFRSLSEQAKGAFDQLPENLDNREYVYMVTDGFEGMIQNDEAGFYDDSISRSFASGCEL